VNPRLMTLVRHEAEMIQHQCVSVGRLVELEELHHAQGGLWKDAAAEHFDLIEACHALTRFSPCAWWRPEFAGEWVEERPVP
jgi:hypothetical protein